MALRGWLVFWSETSGLCHLLCDLACPLRSPWLLGFHHSSSTFHTHCIVFVMNSWHLCPPHGLYRQGFLPYLNSRRKGQAYPAGLANRKHQSHILGPSLVFVCAFYLWWILCLLPPLFSSRTPWLKMSVYFISGGNGTPSDNSCHVQEVQIGEEIKSYRHPVIK